MTDTPKKISNQEICFSALDEDLRVPGVAWEGSPTERLSMLLLVQVVREIREIRRCVERIPEVTR